MCSSILPLLKATSLAVSCCHRVPALAVSVLCCSVLSLFYRFQLKISEDAPSHGLSDQLNLFASVSGTTRQSYICACDCQGGSVPNSDTNLRWSEALVSFPLYIQHWMGHLAHESRSKCHLEQLAQWECLPSTAPKNEKNVWPLLLVQYQAPSFY